MGDCRRLSRTSQRQARGHRPCAELEDQALAVVLPHASANVEPTAAHAHQAPPGRRHGMPEPEMGGDDGGVGWAAAWRRAIGAIWRGLQWLFGLMNY